MSMNEDGINGRKSYDFQNNPSCREQREEKEERERKERDRWALYVIIIMHDHPWSLYVRESRKLFGKYYIERIQGKLIVWRIVY